eukprot:Opistho-1_new@58127
MTGRGRRTSSTALALAGLPTARSTMATGRAACGPDTACSTARRGRGMLVHGGTTSGTASESSTTSNLGPNSWGCSWTIRGTVRGSCSTRMAPYWRGPTTTGAYTASRGTLSRMDRCSRATSPGRRRMVAAGLSSGAAAQSKGTFTVRSQKAPRRPRWSSSRGPPHRTRSHTRTRLTIPSHTAHPTHPRRPFPPLRPPQLRPTAACDGAASTRASWITWPSCVQPKKGRERSTPRRSRTPQRAMARARSCRLLRTTSRAGSSPSSERSCTARPSLRPCVPKQALSTAPLGQGRRRSRACLRRRPRTTDTPSDAFCRTSLTRSRRRTWARMRRRASSRWPRPRCAGTSRTSVAFLQLRTPRLAQCVRRTTTRRRLWEMNRWRQTRRRGMRRSRARWSRSSSRDCRSC